MTGRVLLRSPLRCSLRLPSFGQMQCARRRAFQALLSSSHSLSLLKSSSIVTLAQGLSELLRSTARSPPFLNLATPWAAIQRRGAKILGSDARTGNVIQRKGRTYEVLKAQHTQHGRGGATIQVELRDIDSGSKVTERFRTDEVLEEVLVEDKSLTVLYQDGDTVTLMDPSTFEQLEVHQDLFGKNYSYLKEEMNVTVQYYDGKPASGSVPQRLTCTVVEAQPHSKGLTAAPQYKRVVLDNGLTVMVPPFIEVGDEIVLNTTEDKYLARAKE